MRKKYREEYAARQGRMIYIGDYYTPTGKDLPRRRAAMAALSAAALGLTVAMGFMTNPGARSVYVMLPYGFQLLTTALLPVSAVNFLFARRRLTHYEYDTYFERIRGVAIIAAGLTGLTTAANLINAFTYRLDPGPEALFISLGCAAAACLVWLVRVHGGVAFETSRQAIPPKEPQ